jgi:glucose dehydrogenase
MEALWLPEPLTTSKGGKHPCPDSHAPLYWAVLATMTLTAVAQAQLTGDDAVELFRRGERASQDQPTSDSVKRAALAQERYYSTWSPE